MVVVVSVFLAVRVVRRACAEYALSVDVFAPVADTRNESDAAQLASGRAVKSPEACPRAVCVWWKGVGACVTAAHSILSLLLIICLFESYFSIHLHLFYSYSYPIAIAIIVTLL